MSVCEAVPCFSGELDLRWKLFGVGSNSCPGLFRQNLTRFENHASATRTFSGKGNSCWIT